MEAVSFRRVIVLKKLSQMRIEKSGDSFVRASSESSLAMFDLVSYRS